jgi:hypothetical protein
MPPAVGEIEVYFRGRTAHAFRRRPPDDRRWTELRRLQLASVGARVLTVADGDANLPKGGP